MVSPWLDTMVFEHAGGIGTGVGLSGRTLLPTIGLRGANGWRALLSMLAVVVVVVVEEDRAREGGGGAGRRE